MRAGQPGRLSVLQLDCSGESSAERAACIRRGVPVAKKANGPGGWIRATVEEFFREAGDEGLKGEAKGTDRPHQDSVLKHISAFANTDGGST